LVAKVKPNTNSIGVHPQLSNSRHPVEDGGALMMGAGSLWLVRGAPYTAVSFAICKAFSNKRNAHFGLAFHFLKRPPLFVHSFFSRRPMGRYHTKNT
jgi:hypothetical protein